MTGAAGAIRFAGLRRLRPPRLELSFDVTLHGAEAGRTWAVLPTSLRAGDAQPQSSTAHTVELYEPAGTGRVVVARLRSEDGLAALLLPAGGELTLTGFPIDCWDEPPAEAEIEIVTARALLVDGRPLEDLVTRDLLCDRVAVVDAGALADQLAVVEAFGGGLSTRMAVQLVDESRTSYTVTLTGS